jgi:hypothetical protein
MTEVYYLANPDCVSCKNSDISSKDLTTGNIYAGNIFNIADSFVPNASLYGATKFFGFSIAEYGTFVYKLNGQKIDLQKIQFPDLDTLYLNNKDKSWRLGGI